MLRTPSTAHRLALTPTQARRWVPDLHPLHDADVLAVDDAWQLSPAEGSGPLCEAFVGGANPGSAPSSPSARACGLLPGTA